MVMLEFLLARTNIITCSGRYMWTTRQHVSEVPTPPDNIIFAARCSHRDVSLGVLGIIFFVKDEHNVVSAAGVCRTWRNRRIFGTYIVADTPPVRIIWSVIIMTIIHTLCYRRIFRAASFPEHRVLCMRSPNPLPHMCTRSRPEDRGEQMCHPALAHVLKTPAPGKQHLMALQNRYRRKKKRKKKGFLRLHVYYLHIIIYARTLCRYSQTFRVIVPVLFSTGHYILWVLDEGDDDECIRYGMLFFDPRGCLTYI